MLKIVPGRLKTGFLATACALLLTACGGADTADPPSPLPDFTPEAGFKTLWSVDTGAGYGEFELHLKPFITTDTIFVADIKGRISAIDKSSGREKWEISTDYAVTGGVGGGGGLLFVGTRDGELVALWQNDGRLAWTSPLSSEALTVPAVDLGIVVVRTVDGNLQAFSAATGERLWSYIHPVPSLSLRGNSDPFVYAGGVLAGADNGRLAFLALSNGALLREMPVGVPSGSSDLARLIDVDARAIVDRGIVYAAAYQGRVAALSLENVQPLWARDLSVYQDMSIDKENLYAADEMGHIWAFDRLTGSTVWVQDKLHARPVSGTAVYDNVVLVGDFEGYLHAMHIADGRLVARTRIGDEGINIAPIVENDVIYVFTREGELAALTLQPES
jgi:outer membrane protein assembly factor BamB